MLIDTHAHLNFEAFKNDLDKVIEHCLTENVWFINVGSKYETSKKAVEIAEKYGKGVYAAIGLHPIHSNKEEFDPVRNSISNGVDKEKYKKLARSDKVVAIGEIGLDYYKEYGLFKEKQKEVLLEQFSLAKELNLPVIFHCRKAHEDLLEVLKSNQIRGVIHCFTGNWQQARQYLDIGLYLGFNGIIYKLNLKEVIEKTPLERILIETDCPYLTLPQAGIDRNEPIFVKYIAEDIARIKNLDYQKVAETTTINAKNLFKI